MENAFIWLIKQFSEERFLKGSTLLPVANYDSADYSNPETIVSDILRIVCLQMDVNPDNIKLDYYSQQLIEIRGDTGSSLVGQKYDEDDYSKGQYQGKLADGRYSISLEMGQMTKPEKVVATLAHEIAHIKILGEGLLTKNDEYLTDLVTVFYGVGIFNANAAFHSYSTMDGWGYSSQGYLSQQEWGYALALYAYIRREKDPEWIKFLSNNVKSDYKKAMNYILDNTDKVLV